MNQQKSLIRIAELLSRFKIQTGILNANAQLDINIVSEDTLIPILNIAYNCNLTNAKYSEDDSKFPALDLLDKGNRIAFQITSTPTISKAKKTIEGIIKNSFQTKFDNFYIYIITQKQNNYDKNVLETATQGLFKFTEKNILDEKDLYVKIASLPFDDILKIEKILEKQFSDLTKDENEIQNDIKKIISGEKISADEKFLISEIEGATIARQAWLDKKMFFEKKLPSITDLNQQFSIYTQIEEINDKISFYNDQISSSLIKISN
ncbi:SMEK domain-containing protein [Flavobacterium tistrianum]|uniref:SMEK domain-containing protein n=1 Tax=Flavobacterium tistrianum TaxID=1685414 RepID=UPI000DABD072|nr:SMEK domain-containing protein [Flavobacterium tistrianum]KAF2339465.1 SMEK domain-containing protein [Flavobacterium tistrianum]